MQPKVTILLPVTRECPEVFECLNNLECDHSRTDLLIVVDTDSPMVIHKASEYIEEAPFYDANLVITGNGLPYSLRIVKRRERICEVHNKAKTIKFKGKYLMGVEDDTIFPDDSLIRLVDLIQLRDCGFVEGVQVGRWGFPYVGAWEFKNGEAKTLVPRKDYLGLSRVHKIDAGGFYCFMTPVDLYKKAEFIHNDFGPDVNYGLWLKREGYKSYIDWGLLCGHKTDNVIIWPDAEHIKELKFIEEDGSYVQKTSGV